MLVMAAAGIGLLLSAPLIARLIKGRGSDPVALTRMIQIVAFALLIGALFVRPYNPETTAVPPPPDVPDARAP